MSSPLLLTAKSEEISGVPGLWGSDSSQFQGRSRLGWAAGVGREDGKEKGEGGRRGKEKEKKEGPRVKGRGEDHKGGTSLALECSLPPTPASVWGSLCSALAPGERALRWQAGLGWVDQEGAEQKNKVARACCWDPRVWAEGWGSCLCPKHPATQRQASPRLTR